MENKFEVEREDSDGVSNESAVRGSASASGRWASRWRALLDKLGLGSQPEAPAVLSPRCSTLVGRAQVSNLLAERALHPADPLPYLGAEAVACELSREAIYWSLLAVQEQAAVTPAATVEAEAGAPSSHTFASLWAAVEPSLIERAAGGAEPAARLREDSIHKSFTDFAELTPERQSDTAQRLHAFAAQLIEPLALHQRMQERAWVRRVQLLMLAAVGLVVLVFVGKHLKERYDLSQDLATSASWVASSRYEPECSCHSPEQSCASCPNFFFCTQSEDRPSIEFDLHRVQSLSAVVVDNRADCCPERALPLVVQVSTDHKHWKTVATRKEEFSTWRADFSTEQARWVKLYVARHDFLHLARVRLLP